MCSAAVGQIIAINRRYDDVIQSEIFDDQRDIARFLGIESGWLALVNGTKPAAARTGIAEDEKGCRLVAPALADVGAARLLTNRMKILFAQNMFQAQVVGIPWGFDFDPVGMSSRQVSIGSTVQAVQNVQIVSEPIAAFCSL